MTNIILCGGSGTRLWPISRKHMPKQFVPLFEDKSLYQLTLQRNSKISDDIIIVSNEGQYFLALDQAEDVGITCDKYILEPFGKNTAPAIAMACHLLDENEVVLVTPSDHLIQNIKDYKSSVSRAKELAEEGFLVTFGITPNAPETGYGYIHAKGEDVLSFKEKPDSETAQKYIESKEYHWNSGMFCFKAGVYLNELKKQNVNLIDNAILAIDQSHQENSTYRIKSDDMGKLDDVSIDYAVMEKSDKIKVVASDIGWSDLGSYDSLYDHLPQDESGNTISPSHISMNSSNNLIHSSDRVIATVDIHDLHIVDTPDALLVARKGSGQKVKEIVAKLKVTGSDLPDIHLTTHRPWGTYTILEEGSQYKIKKILVKPQKRLSLQKHFHRNEHWIIVSGTAQVTIGEEVKILRSNESIYIPMGVVHRLQNPGKVDLVLIEAQVGQYLGEDDIVRIADDYKRT